MLDKKIGGFAKKRIIFSCNKNGNRGSNPPA